MQSTAEDQLLVAQVDNKILDRANDRNIVGVLRSIIEVIDWMSLGLLLGLPSCELERIKIDGQDERERLRRMVSLWLDSGTASWRTLVQALFDPLMNKQELARRISQEHPLLESPYQSSATRPQGNSVDQSSTAHPPKDNAGIRITPRDLPTVFQLLKTNSSEWNEGSATAWKSVRDSWIPGIKIKGLFCPRIPGFL